MRLTYVIPNDVDIIEAALAIVSATYPLVGMEAEAFGQQGVGRRFVVLEITDGTEREAVVAAIRAETGYLPDQDPDAQNPDAQDLDAQDPDANAGTLT